MSTTMTSRRSGPGHLHLTRRGRLVLLLVVVATLLAATVVASSAVLASGDASSAAGMQQVTVQPGQTLWDIAGASGARGDMRDAVYEIRQVNHLDSAGVQIGQTLDVPDPD
ncbi:hypothetical protein BH24ACT11_BH24ACT11_15780 [soil metagenome]